MAFSTKSLPFSHYRNLSGASEENNFIGRRIPSEVAIDIEHPLTVQVRRDLGRPTPVPVADNRGISLSAKENQFARRRTTPREVSVVVQQPQSIQVRANLGCAGTVPIAHSRRISRPAEENQPIST